MELLITSSNCYQISDAVVPTITTRLIAFVCQSAYLIFTIAIFKGSVFILFHVDLSSLLISLCYKYHIYIYEKKTSVTSKEKHKMARKSLSLSMSFCIYEHICCVRLFINLSVSVSKQTHQKKTTTTKQANKHNQKKTTNAAPKKQKQKTKSKRQPQRAHDSNPSSLARAAEPNPSEVFIGLPRYFLPL